MATTAKLRHEFDKRTDYNFLATEVLNNNQSLWFQVGGPRAMDLFDPSYAALAEARRAADKLQAKLDADENGIKKPNAQRRSLRRSIKSNRCIGERSTKNASA